MDATTTEQGGANNNKDKVEEPPVPEITLTFDDPAILARLLTRERRRVLQVAREEPMGVAQLARRLKRDTRAVSRDVNLLEKHKLLDSKYVDNPRGHGFQRIVKPAATKIRLVVTV